MRTTGGVLALMAVCLAAAPFLAANQAIEPVFVLADPGVDGVTPPRVVTETQRAPVYPPAALAAGMDGSVALAAVVLADGTVADVAILESDHPNLGFERAAADALRGWRFEPALREGQPVDSYTVLRLHFRSGMRLGGDSYVTGGFVPVASLGESRSMIRDGFAAPASRDGAVRGASHGPIGREKIIKASLPPRSGLYDRRTLLRSPERAADLPRPSAP